MPFDGFDFKLGNLNGKSVGGPYTESAVCYMADIHIGVDLIKSFIQKSNIITILISNMMIKKFYTSL